MKHFYTVLAAALMASAVATAQPMPSKGMRFNYDKKQVAAKKSGYLPMLQFGIQTATGKSVVTASPRKVQAYAEKTSTIAHSLPSNLMVLFITTSIAQAIVSLFFMVV